MKALVAGVALAVVAISGSGSDLVTQFQKECAAGQAGSCTALAAFYAEGQSGLTKDPAKADELNKRGAALSKTACDKGSADGCAELSVDYDQGRGVPKDAARAAALMTQAGAAYQQACDKGNIGDCLTLARAYQDGTRLPKDTARAAALFKKVGTAYEGTCNKGNMDDCLMLGTLYEAGQGVLPDSARARALYKKACAGLPPGPTKEYACARVK